MLVIMYFGVRSEVGKNHGRNEMIGDAGLGEGYYVGLENRFF